MPFLFLFDIKSFVVFNLIHGTVNVDANGVTHRSCIHIHINLVASGKQKEQKSFQWNVSRKKQKIGCVDSLIVVHRNICMAWHMFSTQVKLISFDIMFIPIYDFDVFWLSILLHRFIDFDLCKKKKWYVDGVLCHSFHFHFHCVCCSFFCSKYKCNWSLSVQTFQLHPSYFFVSFPILLCLQQSGWIGKTSSFVAAREKHFIVYAGLRRRAEQTFTE